MCQRTFMVCNTCSTLGEGVDSGGGYVYMGAEGIWELPVLLAQFCWEPKTALPNKVYEKTKSSSPTPPKVEEV